MLTALSDVINPPPTCFGLLSGSNGQGSQYRRTLSRVFSFVMRIVDLKFICHKPCRVDPGTATTASEPSLPSPTISYQTSLLFAFCCFRSGAGDTHFHRNEYSCLLLLFLHTFFGCWVRVVLASSCKKK